MCGSLWLSWLTALILPLNPGRGKSLAGAAVLLACALLCWPVTGQRAGPGYHQGSDVTVHPQASCEDIPAIRGTKGR